MGPLKSTLHIDQLLSNISIKYKNESYIADQVFPEVMVKKDHDLYRIYDRNFKLPETKRANRGIAREYGFDVSTASYHLEHHALKAFISDSDKENYDLAILEADHTENLTDKILLRRENSVAVLFTSSSWSQNTSLSTAQQWSADTTTSNPIPQFDTATTVVLENSGKKPNYAIIPHRQMVQAKNHSSIIDRIKYTSAEITPNMLAGLFDMPKILVPLAVVDSAAEGLAASVAALWNDNVFIGYRPQNASPLEPSAGYIFRNSMPMVKKWREEERDSDVVEVNMKYVPKVVASLAGYLLKDVSA